VVVFYLTTKIVLYLLLLHSFTTETKKAPVRLFSFLFCFLIVILSGSAQALAHGVHTRNSLSEATVVTTLHDDGSPLAFADYTVYSPHGGPAFSKGKTDSLGRVVFLPNAPGKWEIKIFASDGHGSVTTVDVSPAGSELSADHQKQAPGQIQKLITGGGILFGIFGLLVLVQNRKPGKE